MSILREFYGQFITRTYKKGEVILLQDQFPESAYAVKVGAVRMYGLGPDGVVNSISFLVTGELFPVGWIFSKTAKTLFYYEVHTDVTVYVMDKQRLLDAIDSNPELSNIFLNDQVKQYVGTNLQIKALGQPRAELKIIGIFHYLCLRYGTEIAVDSVRIEIPFTQDELASLIGITRETTTNELLTLKAAGVLIVRNKFYTVNTRKLNKLLDGEYNPGIELD
jgi:CRP/FNR family cyclic AMP-dependent transcriptional regulator